MNPAEQPRGSRVSQCRTCQADIVWLHTAAGKLMPVDAATAKPDDTEFDRTRHTAHFVTCPEANVRRRPR